MADQNVSYLPAGYDGYHVRDSSSVDHVVRAKMAIASGSVVAFFEGDNEINTGNWVASFVNPACVKPWVDTQKEEA